MPDEHPSRREEELERRVRKQRGLREVDLREPDPSPPPAIQSRIAATAQIGGFFLDCVCGETIITQARTGTCGHCGREFDCTGWGQ